MMNEAHSVGLRYDKAIRHEVTAHINSDGEEYDSRAGIAGYYRYGPRQVAALSHDTDHGVEVPVVHVHPEAFDRIKRRRRNYEPVSLGCPFSVGRVPQPSADVVAMENAWDMVWWRRVAYFTTVVLTAFVSLFALRLAFDWPNVILDFAEPKFQWLWS